MVRAFLCVFVLFFISIACFPVDLLLNKSDGDIWYASDVNSILNHLDGSLFPIDPTTRNKYDNSADLGSGTYRWNDGFFGGGLNIGTATGAGAGEIKASGRIIGSNLAFVGSQLEELATNADTSILINYAGYSNGGTQFRNLNVCDGKTNSILYVDGSAGNVGIGTTAPDSNLHVNSSGTTTLEIDGSATGSPTLKMSQNSSDKLWLFYDNSTGAIGLNVDASSNGGIHIRSDNKVGIGTTAPDKALEINSATGANLRLTYNDSNGSAVNYADFSITSSGNLSITPSGGKVGVGVASPSAPLDVLQSGGESIRLTDGAEHAKLYKSAGALYINNASTTGDSYYQNASLATYSHNFHSGSRSVAKISNGEHRANGYYGDEIKFFSPSYSNPLDVDVYVTANSTVAIQFEYLYQAVNGTTVISKTGMGTALFNNSAGTVTANVTLHDEVDLGGFGGVTATVVDTTGSATAIRFTAASPPAGTIEFFFTGRALGNARYHTNNLYKIIE